MHFDVDIEMENSSQKPPAESFQMQSPLHQAAPFPMGQRSQEIALCWPHEIWVCADATSVNAPNIKKGETFIIPECMGSFHLQKMKILRGICGVLGIAGVWV
jgi:hypothetical protein